MLLLEMVAVGHCESVQVAAGEVVAENMIATKPSMVELSSLDPHKRHWLLELMSVESISPDLTQVNVHLSNWTMAWPMIAPEIPANVTVGSDEIQLVGYLEFQNRIEGTLAIAYEFP
ncbi:hypothetical protein R1flu_020822 [Riccia fluitans]|uniref:Uncharacterized protein n=1 Tax=Riccia fluitans TaxID=41844 RepID=A0ABD1ZMM0_9MARC